MQYVPISSRPKESPMSVQSVQRSRLGLRALTATQQIVGRERRERLSQLTWCGEGCFESRRRVNSTVGPHIMNAPSRQPWFGTVILIGVLYCVIGIVFALPSNQVGIWRLAAWVVSAALYAAHIAYEHF